jgi:hypothetical protein
MILLTREEAEYVLGLSPITVHGASALEPAPLMDGSYVLPEDVLDDPSNVDVEPFLSTKVVPGDPDPALLWDFGTPDDPNEHDIIAYNAMKLTWSEPVDERASVQRASRVGYERKTSRKR